MIKILEYAAELFWLPREPSAEDRFVDKLEESVDMMRRRADKIRSQQPSWKEEPRLIFYGLDPKSLTGQRTFEELIPQFSSGVALEELQMMNAVRYQAMSRKERRDLIHRAGHEKYDRMPNREQAVPAQDHRKIQGVRTFLWVDDDGVLYCPLCGEMYGLHLTETSKTEETITIGGWCEICGKYFAIDFMQHEGATLTGIRDLGEHTYG